MTLWLLEFLVVLMIFGEIAHKAVAWGISRRRLARTFDLTLDSGSPDPKGAGLGATPIFVRITINEPTEIARFRFQLVDKVNGGGVASPAIVKIERVSYHSPITNQGLSLWEDTEGGYYGGWGLRQLLEKGDTLRFGVFVQALKPWSGYLRFQGHDAKNNVRFVYLPVKFGDR